LLRTSASTSDGDPSLSEVGRDLALLAPVAIEVEPRAHEPKRAGGIRVVRLADRDERA
jgi:hypothetical protein